MNMSLSSCWPGSLGALNLSLLTALCFRGWRLMMWHRFSSGWPTMSHQFSSFREGNLQQQGQGPDVIWF